LARDERGASAVEYGLIAFAIAALIVVILFALGGAVSGMFSDSCDEIQGKAAPTSTC
jgi:Flp pilus assembly pilin Flp